MKNIHYLLKILFFTIALMIGGCEKETYEFGDIITPSNLSVIAEVVGTDAANPYGDGSGEVIFTATSDDVITYKYVIEGSSTMAPSGRLSHLFSTTGVHSYNVTVIAVGTAGTMTSKTIEVEVFVLYQPPADLLQMLVGDGTRTWRLKSEASGHFGVGPADATTPIWWAAGPYEKDGLGAYDDRFTFNADGTFTHTTNGNAYGKAPAMDTEIGNSHSLSANGNNEYENYPLDNYSEKWSLSAPGGQETLSFSHIGYHGFYVGGDHKYAILARSANEMTLRTVGSDGLGWFAILVAED